MQQKLEAVSSNVIIPNHLPVTWVWHGATQLSWESISSRKNDEKLLHLLETQILLSFNTELALEEYGSILLIFALGLRSSFFTVLSSEMRSISTLELRKESLLS